MFENEKKFTRVSFSNSIKGQRFATALNILEIYWQNLLQNPIKSHQIPSKPIKPYFKTHQSPSDLSKPIKTPSKPIKTYFKAHQTPSKSITNYFKTHQTPSKPIKPHQNASTLEYCTELPKYAQLWFLLFKPYLDIRLLSSGRIEPGGAKFHVEYCA